MRTFNAVATDFLALHVATKRKGRTGDEYARILKGYILPAIGSMRIVDVRRADVAKLHSKLSASPYQANRAVALVSAVWNWAARRRRSSLRGQPGTCDRTLSRKGTRAVSDKRRVSAARRRSPRRRNRRPCLLR